MDFQMLLLNHNFQQPNQLASMAALLMARIQKVIGPWNCSYAAKSGVGDGEEDVLLLAVMNLSFPEFYLLISENCQK